MRHPAAMHTPEIEVRAAASWVARGPASVVLLVRAARDPRQDVLAEDLRVRGGEIEHGPTGSDGGERPFRLRTAGGRLSVAYEAQVRREPEDVSADPSGPLPEHDRLPFALLPWTLPSRYCPSDLLAPTAEAMFGHRERCRDLIPRVVGWVGANLAYRPGASTSLTTADESLLRREGVCRDMAHVAIALLRGLGIPARMVAGFALDLDPPDFHALVEAHDGVAWRLHDATGLAPTDTVVRIATGRDAADVAWATVTGPMAPEAVAVAVARTR
jgi:transglutaminase-like putative cysteine protease